MPLFLLLALFILLRGWMGLDVSSEALTASYVDQFKGALQRKTKECDVYKEKTVNLTRHNTQLEKALQEVNEEKTFHEAHARLLFPGTCLSNARPGAIVRIVASWFDGHDVSIACCLKIGSNWMILEEEDVDQSNMSMNYLLTSLSAIKEEEGRYRSISSCVSNAMLDGAAEEVGLCVNPIHLSDILACGWTQGHDSVAITVSSEHCVWILVGVTAVNAFNSVRNAWSLLESASEVIMSTVTRDLHKQAGEDEVAELKSSLSVSQCLLSPGGCSAVWKALPAALLESCPLFLQKEGGVACDVMLFATSARRDREEINATDRVRGPTVLLSALSGTSTPLSTGTDTDTPGSLRRASLTERAISNREDVFVCNNPINAERHSAVDCGWGDDKCADRDEMFLAVLPLWTAESDNEGSRFVRSDGVVVRGAVVFRCTKPISPQDVSCLRRWVGCVRLVAGWSEVNVWGLVRAAAADAGELTSGERDQSIAAETGRLTERVLSGNGMHGLPQEKGMMDWLRACFNCDHLCVMPAPSGDKSPILVDEEERKEIKGQLFSCLDSLQRARAGAAEVLNDVHLNESEIKLCHSLLRDGGGVKQEHSHGTGHRLALGGAASLLPLHVFCARVRLWEGEAQAIPTASASVASDTISSNDSCCAGEFIMVGFRRRTHFNHSHVKSCCYHIHSFLGTLLCWRQKTGQIVSLQGALAGAQGQVSMMEREIKVKMGEKIEVGRFKKMLADERGGKGLLSALRISSRSGVWGPQARLVVCAVDGITGRLWQLEATHHDHPDAAEMGSSIDETRWCPLDPSLRHPLECGRNLPSHPDPCSGICRKSTDVGEFYTTSEGKEGSWYMLRKLYMEKGAENGSEAGIAVDTSSLLSVHLLVVKGNEGDGCHISSSLSSELGEWVSVLCEFFSRHANDILPIGSWWDAGESDKLRVIEVASSYMNGIPLSLHAAGLDQDRNRDSDAEDLSYLKPWEYFRDDSVWQCVVKCCGGGRREVRVVAAVLEEDDGTCVDVMTFRRADSFDRRALQTHINGPEDDSRDDSGVRERDCAQYFYRPNAQCSVAVLQSSCSITRDALIRHLQKGSRRVSSEIMRDTVVKVTFGHNFRDGRNRTRERRKCTMHTFILLPRNELFSRADIHRIGSAVCSMLAPLPLMVLHVDLHVDLASVFSLFSAQAHDGDNTVITDIYSTASDRGVGRFSVIEGCSPGDEVHVARAEHTAAVVTVSKPVRKLADSRRLMGMRQLFLAVGGLFPRALRGERSSEESIEGVVLVDGAVYFCGGDKRGPLGVVATHDYCESRSDSSSRNQSLCSFRSQITEITSSVRDGVTIDVLAHEQADDVTVPKSCGNGCGDGVTIIRLSFFHRSSSASEVMFLRVETAGAELVPGGSSSFALSPLLLLLTQLTHHSLIPLAAICDAETSLLKQHRHSVEKHKKHTLWALSQVKGLFGQLSDKKELTIDMKLCESENVGHKGALSCVFTDVSALTCTCCSHAADEEYAAQVSSCIEDMFFESRAIKATMRDLHSLSNDQNGKVR